MKTNHKQVRVKDNHGEIVNVDVKIAPLLQAVWACNINTLMSCQNHKPFNTQGPLPVIGRWIWIEFKDMRDLEIFLSLVANRLPDVLTPAAAMAVYTRMARWHEKAWLYRIQPFDAAGMDGTLTAERMWQATFLISMPQLWFPVTDYSAVLAALTAAAKDEIRTNAFSAELTRAVAAQGEEDAVALVTTADQQELT